MMSSTTWRMPYPIVTPRHTHAQNGTELLCLLAQ
jgi:hypothetical protein